MKNIAWYWWFVWVAISLLQISVIPNFRIGNSMPNIVVIFISVVSLLADKEYLAWEGMIVAGFMLDVFQNDRFGLISLILFVIVFAMRYFRKWYTDEINGLILWLGIILAQLGYDLFLITVNNLWASGDLAIIVGDVIFTGSVGLVMIGCIYLINPRLFQRGV